MGRYGNRTERKIPIDDDLWKLVRATAVLEGMTAADWIDQKLRAELAHLIPQPAGLDEAHEVRTDG